MECNVKGWISKITDDNVFIGWLLDITNSNPRTAIIRINDSCCKEVLCNRTRNSPRSYKEFLNNGFRVSLDQEIVSSLRIENNIALIDKNTGVNVHNSKFHITESELENLRNIFKVSVKTTNSSVPVKSTDTNTKIKRINDGLAVSGGAKVTQNSYKGKLNSKFSNFKITGWLVKDNAKVQTVSEIIIKLDGKFSFSSVADIKRGDLESKGINGGVGGFSIDIPIEVISQLPSTFKAELYAKEGNILVNTVEYSNIKLFSPQNVHEYLCYSMVNPVIYAPFVENHKRCFAFMENVASMLEQEVKDQEQLVSVIMPVFNRQDVVLDSIKSVLEQTYQNFELIIIDDCSTDDSVKVIESVKDPRITILKNKVNRGCSFSRNYGVNNSHGDYIFYLDSDNTWDSRYLKVMMGAFKKVFDAQALYCGQYLFRGNSKNCYAVRYASFNRALLENRNYIDLNCFCHTRKAFESIGGFDVNLQRLVDYDLILRLSDKFDIYSVPVILSNYFLGKCDNAITSVKPLVALDRKGKDNAKTSNKKADYRTKLHVSAIIPNYETIDDLEECIDSLVECCCSEIIVVDNNSSKETTDRLDKLADKKVIKLIKNKHNYGFTYAVNQGIKEASENNDILLVNNDSVFTKNAIYEMRKAAYTLESVGLVVPRQVLFSGNPSISAHVPFANPNSECDVNLSVHHFNIENVPLISNGKIVELSFAPFFCVYIRRDVFEKAGYLDAQHGRHYRSDRIYCDVIRHILGLKIYYVSSSVVYHKLQKSTANMKKQKSDDYQLIFIQNKWSKEERLERGYIEKAWE